MDSDPGVTELDSPQDDPVKTSEQHYEEHDCDSMLLSVHTGRRLISGLMGLNMVLLGAALVLGHALNPAGLTNHEPRVFMLLLMGVSVLWMLWHLLWARRQPGFSPHKDHHAGGGPVTIVVHVFAVFSLLLYTCRIGYFISTRECQAATKVLSPFIEAPFLALQTYFLWVHSKDCIHTQKIITRIGLMLILSSDILLWLSAVTEESIHVEIESEKLVSLQLSTENSSEAEMSDLAGFPNSTLCYCRFSAVCLSFRKAIEVLHPFHMEYYLMAGCMIYVMWKNVGRRISPSDHHHDTHKRILHVVLKGGTVYGLILGGLVLIAGVTIFVLYHVFVSLPNLRLTAFFIFYGYHLAVTPLMALCCLAGVVVHQLERRASEGGYNPTRSLDVMLLLASALGQLVLSYFSLVAALAVGTEGLLEGLDLSYSLLSLLELILQNIFIIKGLHRHTSLFNKKKKKQWSKIFKSKKDTDSVKGEKKTDLSLLEGNTSDAAKEHDGKKSWIKRAIQEICAFLILSNIMLWIIPAFGVHPQFENGIGKTFFGFSAWFVLVNLGQPLCVFYRMHSVSALMELLLNA